MRLVGHRTVYFLSALLLAFAIILEPGNARANHLTSRSVFVTSPVISEVTSHRFNFTLASPGTLGSMSFEYCSNSPLLSTPCTAPAGLDVSSATINFQNGETGFSVDGSSTVNELILTRSAAVSSAIPVSYTFGNITNPSLANTTIFVRITTYSSIDATGAYTDDGSVGFSTSSAVSVSGFVPPFLTFCVGVTVAGDCSSASGQQLNFGELSENQPSFVTSQFAGATNDVGGYSTFVSGATMTSGSNIIPALNIPTASIPGLSQFGMNLRANTNPGVGSDPSGIGTSAPSVNYNQPNQYTFNNEMVTTSPLSTNFNLFTASYVVNVAPSQAPGIYNTTLTYTAVAAF